MARAYAVIALRPLLAGTSLLFAGTVAVSACSGTTTRAATSGSGGSSGVGAASSVSSSSKTASSGHGGGSSSSGINFTGSSSSGAGGACNMQNVDCKSAADCTAGPPGTMPACIISGGEVPVGTCVYTACDGGVECSVDSTCSEADAGQVYPPYVPLYPPDVPANCANGFEVCDALGAPTYTIKAVPAAGSRALTLDLDFATYLAPDGLLITGIDGNCQRYVLFDSCRLQTATQPESAYTNGMERPSDVAIRQFHLTLREGTSQLTFDFSNVTSPMYFQILGLCDFNITPVPDVGWFSLVP